MTLVRNFYPRQTQLLTESFCTYRYDVNVRPIFFLTERTNHALSFQTFVLVTIKQMQPFGTTFCKKNKRNFVRF